MQTETRTGPVRARSWWRALEFLAWAAFFAGALGLLFARYWLLPNIERYREDIVAAASRSLGLRISVGSIEAGWSGLRPQLDFADVRVFDRDGREALRLPAVDSVISWRSLLVRELRLHSLAIVGPRLTVRRDAQGVITVAGIRFEPEDGGGLGDWILAQNEIQILGAEIEWRDDKRGAPPLALSGLDLRLHNDGDLHAVGLVAYPPRELGTRLDLRAELVGRSVTAPGAWNGRVFVELGYTDLGGWRAWVDYPLDVRKGEGALRLWTSLERGRITRATADVALTGVAARLAPELPVLELTSLSGRLQGRELGRGYEFGVRHLALAAAHGAPMRSTSFAATWLRGEAGQPPKGSVSAERIELAPLAQLAAYLPVPEALRKQAAELSPTGELFGVRFDWKGDLPRPAAFTGRTRFSGLGMNAWGPVPGFSGLSGSIEASDAEGNLHLASRRLTLDLPKVFPEPRLALQTLDGDAHWEHRGAGALAVRIANVRFANDDLAGSAVGAYRYDGSGPGAIDLSAQLTRADGRSTAKYLPRAEILGAETRAWLVEAIRGGEASEAQLRLKGDLRDFPFTDRTKGEFRIAARVKRGVLDVAAGWPRIEDIDGELVFERDHVAIVARSGRILGARIANVRAAIPSLLAASTVLSVEGTAEGPTAQFLEYVRRSPVRGMIDGLTDAMRAEGRGRLQLKLALPLGDLAKTRVVGEFRFADNTVTVDPRLPPVGRASGRIAFTESALSVNDVRGELFGGPVTISGGSGAQGSVTIVARGEATVPGIAPLFDHPWRARLSGSARYSATVNVSAGRSWIVFESALRGVASTLPPPLAKSAADPLPLRVEVEPAGERQRVALQLGTVAAAELERARRGDAMILRRAGVVLGPQPGERAPLPEDRGVAIRGGLATLDFDRWRPLLEAGGGATARFDLRFGTLDVLDKRLTEVSLRGNTTEDGGWRAALVSKEMAGELDYRAARGGRLSARLTHLSIPQDAPGTGGAAAAAEAAGAQPRETDLAALDLRAEKFTRGGRQLGSVELAAERDGPDWRIARFSLTGPDGSVSGKGTLHSGRAPQTALELKLESGDVGKLLERLGYADRVRGGTGSLEGSVAWDGEPSEIDTASLSGQLALRIEGGAFPRLDAGFGRLLSLVGLNLAEATAKGYPFDLLSGAFALKRGVAHTEDLKLRSSAAEVTMQGDIDLRRETQKLRVRVVPGVRRGVSTLATIVNPAVGVGVLVGQAVLKDPLGHFLAVDYNVSGSWADPKVERIEPAGPPADASTQFLPKN